ncbi:hypothetical protein JRC04_04855 [Mycolicibacterium sp. S2-37]|uniref:hypothetical protein n=1 Tax=Mycolicibacterium sp. S2-37 TaxID=2810297 RepID=UPI001A94ADFB|nr:hypothetical protein [Mycolicibacterium sp. S2-37]MBO0676789.1 hypothetical protein [Mycolicibacterium sp. S2-37]
MAVDLSRKASTLVGFPLATPEDMHAALAYLAPGGGITGNGYTGSVTQQHSGSAPTVVWRLLINNPITNASAFAEIGDVIVLENNAIASVCKQDNFESLYDVQP